jgi:hypothetical protein
MLETDRNQAAVRDQVPHRNRTLMAADRNPAAVRNRTLAAADRNQAVVLDHTLAAADRNQAVVLTIPWRRTVTRWAHLAAPTGFHCRQMNAAHRRQRRGLSSQASDDPAASRRHTTAEAGDVRAAGHRQISAHR